MPRKVGTGIVMRTCNTKRNDTILVKRYDIILYMGVYARKSATLNYRILEESDRTAHVAPEILF